MKLRFFVAAGLVMFGAQGALACPDFTQTAAQTHSLTGQDLYFGNEIEVVAGGNASLESCRKVVPISGGTGYFPQAPDFAFDLTGMGTFKLEISVVSACDAALLVNTSDAVWVYDDDSNGSLDPKITLEAPNDGKLDIWIGTFDGNYCDATLTLETYLR